MMVDAWNKKVGEIQSMLIKSPQNFGEKRDTQADDPQFKKKMDQMQQEYVIQRKLKSYSLLAWRNHEMLSWLELGLELDLEG